MEDNTGLKRILRMHFFYSFLQSIVGGNRLRANFITDYVRAKPGDKVVEIGCGPAQLFSYFPANLEYIGLDTNQDYINKARKKYGRRGLFLIGNTDSLKDNNVFLNADIVICCTILHHLNDTEAVHAIKFAYNILKTGGRLVCLEPCHVPNQGFFAKLVIENDRGKNIRTEKGYLNLVEKVFSNTKASFLEKQLIIPTTELIIDCIK